MPRARGGLLVPGAGWGEPVGELVAGRRVGDAGGQGQHLRQERAPRLVTREIASGRGALEGELEIRPRLLQGVGEGGRAPAADAGVGVLARRKQRHVDLQPFGDEQLAGTDGGSLPRGVRVETDDDLRREASQQSHLRRRQRRPAGGHDRLDPSLHDLREVEVAFDQDGVAEPADGLLRQVQAVERAALGIERSLRGVEVLGLLAHAERPPAEGDHRAPVPADGNRQPVAEAVHGPGSLALDHEPALEQDVERVTRVEEVALQALALSGGESEPELFRCRRPNRPRVEVRAGLRPGRRGELLPEVVAGPLVHRQEGLALGLRRRVAGRVVRHRHLDSEALRQRLHRVRKGEALVELDELDDVAAGPAAEAVEEAPVPVHGERRRLLGVERTEPLVAGARPPEGDHFLHDLHDVGLRLQVVEEARRKARHDCPARPASRRPRPRP